MGSGAEAGIPPACRLQGPDSLLVHVVNETFMI